MRWQQSSVLQSSAPPAAPRPCGPQGLVVSLCERLSSPGYLPSCHFLLYLSQQGAAPNGPNIPEHLSPACLHCCWESPPPFPFSIHSTLCGTLRKTHWVKLEFYPSLSTVPSPFPCFFLTWNLCTMGDQSAAPGFSDEKPHLPEWGQLPSLFSSRPMGKSLQELSFIFSISSQSYFPGAPPYTQLKFRKVGWELPRPSVWNKNKAPFTQSLPGQRKGRESPHLAGGWRSWGDGNDVTLPLRGGGIMASVSLLFPPEFWASEPVYSGSWGKGVPRHLFC